MRIENGSETLIRLIIRDQARFDHAESLTAENPIGYSLHMNPMSLRTSAKSSCRRELHGNERQIRMYRTTIGPAAGFSRATKPSFRCRLTSIGLLAYTALFPLPVGNPKAYAQEKTSANNAAGQNGAADQESKESGQANVVFQEDFSTGADRWETTDSGSWELMQEGDNKIFGLNKRISKYEPKVRSPHNIALIRDLTVEDFAIEFSVRSTKDTGNHRDCCVFFGYQDPEHFYYVHLGAKPDPASGQIMIVDGAPRRPLTQNTRPVPWDDQWHRVRLERRFSSGKIAVYFDSMDEPLMQVEDKSFGKGRIGIGSFDDQNAFDDIKVIALNQKSSDGAPSKPATNGNSKAENKKVAGAKSTTQAQGTKAPPARPEPTFSDYVYAQDSPRQRFDFWKAKSESPTPLVLLIHGGGWKGGDKTNYGNDPIKKYLNAGISVAAINYRFIDQAMEQGVEPPVRAPLHDAARALQTLRFKAVEWNIDPNKVGATGSSAGACTSLWLAFHDDLADPNSTDPVARQSTRLSCAAVVGAQTSLDPIQLRHWISNSIYGGHAFGFAAKGRSREAEFELLIENREKVLPWIREYSPIELVNAGDPPVFLEYPKQTKAPTLGGKEADPTHSAMYGIGLQKRCREVGVDCQLVYPAMEKSGESTSLSSNSQEFLIRHLTGR